MSDVVRAFFLWVTAVTLSACTIFPNRLPPITPIAPPPGIRDIVKVNQIPLPWPDPASITAPSICTDPNNRHEELVAEEVENFTTYIYAQSCGWNESEQIAITLTFPDGTIEQHSTVETEEIFNSNFASFQHKWEPTNNIGPFTISFQGNKETIAHTIHVAPPVGPRIYRLLDGNLWLYQFEPNETVRIFQYSLAARNGAEQQYQLVAWQTAVTDTAGKLLLKTTIEPEQFSVYIVVGEESGEVHIRSTAEETRIIMP